VVFFAKLSIFLLKIKSERELPCSLWKNGILVLCGKYQLLPTKNRQFVDWIIPILWLDNGCFLLNILGKSLFWGVK